MNKGNTHTHTHTHTVSQLRNAIEIETDDHSIMKINIEELFTMIHNQLTTATGQGRYSLIFTSIKHTHALIYSAISTFRGGDDTDCFTGRVDPSVFRVRRKHAHNESVSYR